MAELDNTNNGYNGNRNLRRSGVRLGFTAEQMSEWVKCRDDPIYFVEKYIKIVTLDHGLQPMKLYPFQKEIIEKATNNNKLITRVARQCGKSSTTAAFFCHYIIFNDQKTCAILANKAATAREILAKVQLAYEHLPAWLQHGVTEWNKGSFVLENGSRILASATSGSAIRGFTINLLALDEFAFLNSKLADEFFTSVYPTISSGKTSKLLVISTPNGMNHFYKMWEEAIAGINGFATVSADWTAVPWRDAAWAAEQLSVLGAVKFAQEFLCEFLGSSNTLISSVKLKNIPTARPLVANDTTAVYARPIPNHKYVMTVDTSRGTGGDYSAFLVIDITTLPYSVAFRYKNNTISSILYPGVLFKIAMEYNSATVYIETNDIGEGVANALYYDLEYENVVFSKNGVVVVWGGRDSLPGVRTTTKTKRIGCDQLKQLIETDKLEVNDYDIRIELCNFVAHKNSYAADVGHDDLAMCLVMFGYLVSTVKFEELTDISVRNRIIEERAAEEEANTLPIGFFTNGLEEEVDNFQF